MVQTGGNETQHYVGVSSSWKGVELKLIKGGGSSSKGGSSSAKSSLLFVDLQKERNPYLPLWTEICDENCEHYEELRQSFLGMLQNGGCNFFKWCTDVGSEDNGRYVKSEGKKETLVISEELEMYEGVDLVGFFLCVIMMILVSMLVRMG
ncbi:hypothetical protein V8G54_037664 [Vigna mungo]|uniref:Uncharacterized protein n=1 Tax=Vigna mungo TaxID=3915 RepID=A0AAQ3MJN8_VIGMU